MGRPSNADKLAKDEELEALRAKLTELDIPFEEDASLKDLQALLPEAKKEGADEDEKEPAASKPVAKPAVKHKAHWPKGFVPTGNKRADTKTLLDLAPKVRFFCPLAEGEKPGATETAHINGYPFIIAKGKMVDLPQPVAELLSKKYEVELEVAQRAQADATPQRAAALSR